MSSTSQFSVSRVGRVRDPDCRPMLVLSESGFSSRILDPVTRMASDKFHSSPSVPEILAVDDDEDIDEF